MSAEYDTVSPPGGKRMKTDDSIEQKRILYVVLEGCSLESAKVSFHLLGNIYIILVSIYIHCSSIYLDWKGLRDSMQRQAREFPAEE